VYRLELTWREPGGQLRLRGMAVTTLGAHDAQALARLRADPAASPSSRILLGLWLRARGARALAQPYLLP